MKFFPKNKMLKTPFSIKTALNIWPSYLFSGIRVKSISANFKSVHVQLRKRFFNLNYVGTHFGGNLYAMVDPFYMLMVMRNLGDKYFVWDIAAKINFIKPGNNTVYCKMEITEEDLKEIESATSTGDKYIKTFSALILSDTNEIVCEVEKRVYIRLKPKYRKKN